MSTFIACGYDIAWNFDHLRALALVPTRKRGAVAQLGERLNGIQEVDGSIPFGSTKTNQQLRATDRSSILLQPHKNSQ